MTNIKSIINIHNKEVITEKKTQAVKCNCINRLSNQCQITNIIYKAKTTSNLRNYHEKIYFGTSKSTFKQRYGNHKKSFNHEKHRTDTELSNEHWRLKASQSTTSSNILHFKKMPANKNNTYLLFMFERETFLVYH